MKSILVIDTPASCGVCPVDDDICKLWQTVKVGKIHPQCPLQDTTDLLEALESIKNGVRNVTKDKPSIEYINSKINKLHKALGGNYEK